MFFAAIKARPISTKRVGRNISFTKVEVRGVLKCSSVRVLPHSVVTLWSNSTCRCPRLKAGKEYLLMGYEDRTHGRLVFPQTAVATPWKKKWLPRILVSSIIIRTVFQVCKRQISWTYQWMVMHFDLAECSFLEGYSYRDFLHIIFLCHGESLWLFIVL